MKQEIFIEGLGFRNPTREHPDIIWYLETFSSTLLSKGRKTMFFLDFLEEFSERLQSMQAYELLSYIHSRLSQKQIDNRIALRLLQEFKGQIERLNFTERIKRKRNK